MNARLLITLVVLASTGVGCTTTQPEQQPHESIPACIVIYDAGSSRTRLYVYEQTATGWLRHPGPTTPALADPIRNIRGKTMADADKTIDALIGALSAIRVDGPPGENGIPLWTAFDWQRKCNVEAGAVYGTAGMRIAAQHNAGASSAVWTKLNTRLAETLGLPVTTRPVSEYEEGLYAWLALGETQVDVNFGVAEMGGASLQVAFPCSSCEGARNVRVNGRTMEIFSHSFLGWGQDEVWTSVGHAPVCKWGAGVENQTWGIADCEAVMTGFALAAADVAGLIKDAAGLRWHLTDAFRYMRSNDIENFCRKGVDGGFQTESSCFRAVYLQFVLKTLAIPPETEKSGVNWTLGAVVCTATRCLESGQEP